MRVNAEEFVDLPWADAEVGQTVWLRGTHDGRFRAYGPHVVHSVEKRKLRNSRGSVFMHYAEDLLKNA